MRIGIDIDGVLTDVDRFSMDYFNKYLVDNNISYKIGTSHYNICCTFNVAEEVEDAFWDEYLDFYTTEEHARPCASEVIKKLKKENHEIYIITSRYLTDRNDQKGQMMRNAVKKWLSDNKISYDKIIFSVEKDNKKTKCCLDNNIDLMIEDKPGNIMKLSTILPVICFDTNYNKKCVGNNIFRCYSWYDIYRKINEMK
ncbi:MAG: hypothetical protein PHN72_01710 [Bacilli bacterium]|nr:hypothetical protein [Bacilli bacterium]